ncbi:MAG TPA: NCS1 family nucleobase:cation symporter-1, partial [Phycisphaerales bacterium]|nr:NCS1 family nucleobase:cation symporter-1 [Phycisphaerales bacterium]
TVLLGNLIVLVPMIANGHGGTKYGVPFPVLARASFGTVGAHVPAIARAIVACGWFGIQTWIGGAAIYSILVTLDWITPATEANILPFLGISSGQFLCFLMFWLLHVAIVVTGIESIKWFEVYAAPFLIACGIALLIWAFVAVDDTAALFTTSTPRPDGVSFWSIFFPQLTAMVGFWATLSLNIPDFTRYCRSQKDQAAGQLIGLPSTMTLFSFVGIIVTGATVVLYGQAIWDPVELVARMGSSWIVVLSMVALLIATLSTNLAANVVSPANGFSNLAPRWISFRTGALMTAAIGILIMPWRLMTDLSDYIFVWLIGYSALLGPIAGIMLCDYFVIRRTELDVEALYDPEGEYAGISLAAMLALVLSVLPNLPGFINAVTGTAGTEEAFFHAFFDQIYGYAWFIGLPLAMFFYWLFKINSAALSGAGSLRFR